MLWRDQRGYGDQRIQYGQAPRFRKSFLLVCGVVVVQALLCLEAGGFVDNRKRAIMCTGPFQPFSVDARTRGDSPVKVLCLRVSS